MSEPLEAPHRPRARRSHAERRAETRARVVEATAEAISELGFDRTTAAEIARRSGVSWGAAQHHFGDKTGILVAVLVESFNRLVAELEGRPAPGSTLDERVDAFVEGVWAHLGSPHYRGTFEILLNLPREDWGDDEGVLGAQTLSVWNGIWDRFFGATKLPRRRRVALQYYVVSTLSGLAAFKRFEGPTAEQRRLELGFLKDTLRRELGEANTL